jgi:katanin p60 ATPase-containing subunit A1
LADNIDFYYILQDFEEYFEMKFMRPPVIVKKAPETASDLRQKRGLPPAPKSTVGSSKKSSVSTQDNSKDENHTP